MRRLLAALAAVPLVVAAIGAALAQPAPRTPPGLTPLGPVQAPRPSAPNQPFVTQGQDPLAPVQSQPLPSLTPPDPAYAPPARPAPAAPPTVAAPLPATALAGDWQPRQTVELRGLDKVTARSAAITGKVGETLRYGTLSILVRGCAVRPPDQPADVTAFLEITDRGATTPIFRGWMITSAPSLAILEHPVYDIRVAACRP